MVGSIYDFHPQCGLGDVFSQSTSGAYVVRWTQMLINIFPTLILRKSPIFPLSSACCFFSG